MTDRTTTTTTTAAYERLAEHKQDDESWSQLFRRAADALEDQEGEHEPNTVVVENIDEIARASADEVENRMARR